MSNSTNDLLYERAQEVLEYFDGHPSGYDKALSKAVMAEDLNEIRRFVTLLEGEMAITAMHDWNVAV